MKRRRLAADDDGVAAAVSELRLQRFAALRIEELDAGVRRELQHAEAVVGQCLHGTDAVSSGEALSRAQAAAAAADAARESTFPFLERMVDPMYNAAYAAAALLYAGALLMEAAHASPQRSVGACRDALRALDLAMLRGGVEAWGGYAEPIVAAATAFVA